MESAVSSGLKTAELILEPRGEQPDVARLPLLYPPRWLLLLLKYVGILPVFLVRLSLWIQGKESRPVGVDG